jgi:hypothetical protein
MVSRRLCGEVSKRWLRELFTLPCTGPYRLSYARCGKRLALLLVSWARMPDGRSPGFTSAKTPNVVSMCPNSASGAKRVGWILPQGSDVCFRNSSAALSANQSGFGLRLLFASYLTFSGTRDSERHSRQQQLDESLRG